MCAKKMEILYNYMTASTYSAITPNPGEHINRKKKKINTQAHKRDKVD